EARVDHAAANGDKDQEERAKQFGEQAPALEPVVPEIELVDHRIRHPYGPRIELGTVGRFPYACTRRGDLSVWLVRHPRLLSCPWRRPSRHHAWRIRPYPANNQRSIEQLVNRIARAG